MALPITTAADYTGFMRVSTSKSSQLDEYITEFERKYLREIVGDEAYNDILTQNPLDTKYTDLIDGVNYTDENGDFVAYQGLKRALIRFVYAHFVTDNFQTSIGGNVRSVNENSSTLELSNTQIVYKRFNDAVTIYCNEVLKFLWEHDELSEEIITSVQGVGIYTFTVASTKYLADGDTITVLGKDYTVSNLIADTSFEITESDTIVFGGLGIEYTYKPFYEINSVNYNTAWL
jgi:hypothetical protein